MDSFWALIISLLGLIVTVLGWSVTYSQQKQLQRTQKEIQTSINEHSTRFTYLHEMRGKAIDELYKRLDGIMNLLTASVSRVRLDGEQTQAQERNEALQKVGVLIDFYKQNRLYLDSKLCQIMDELIKKLNDFQKKVLVANMLAPQSLGSNFVNMPVILKMLETKRENEYRQFMDEAENIVLEELPEIQRRIEEQIREILGLG